MWIVEFKRYEHSEFESYKIFETELEADAAVKLVTVDGYWFENNVQVDVLFTVRKRLL